MLKNKLLILFLIISMAYVQAQEGKPVEIKLMYYGYYDNNTHYKMPVLIELRDGENLMDSEIAEQKTGIIKSDGTVEIDFGNAADGDYWLIVRAGGFMPVATPDKLSLSSAGIEYDFTTSSEKSVGGSSVMYYSDEKWQIRAGDLDGNLSVGAFDVNKFIPHIGNSVSGSIPANDLIFVLTPPILQSPGNEATEQILDVSLEWHTVANVDSYSLQVSDENDFSNLIYDETGITSLEYEIEDLLLNTEYFWRVKSVIDDTESDWSEIRSFTTTQYAFVIIGNQIWMQKNLDVTHYRNGDEIFHAESDEDWEYAAENGIGAWCYYDNDEDNGEIYGKLYNWYAVNDERGLAPEGWRIPHNNWDWIGLTNNWWTAEASRLSGGYNLWINGDLRNHDEFGSTQFRAYPSGLRYPNGQFEFMGSYTYFWTSTPQGENFSHSPLIRYNSTGVNTAKTMYNTYGLSVRCMRDY